MNETLITQAGLARLTDELEQLTTVGRAAIAERISAAAIEANPAESADYHGVRDDQALLERRIALLNERIAHATVVEPDATNGKVDVGERVTLRDCTSGAVFEYELVGTFEADPSAGRISAVSPVGQALLGRRLGDIAVVDAPKGRMQFEVVAIADDAGAQDMAGRATPAVPRLAYGRG